MKKTISCIGFIVLLSFNVSAAPADGRVDIWPSIPFIRGADLCVYRDAYSQTRSEYMSKMLGHASQLMRSGAYGDEALNLLLAFNSTYEQNLEYATRYQYLDVTLEATLKSYLDSYYRQLKPRNKKISFTNVNDILSIIEAAKRGQRDGYITQDMMARLDYLAYGSYSLAPNCAGDIQVTLHLLGKNGDTQSYMAQGTPQYVMSKIASEIFESFQRTQFPSQIKVGEKILELVGGLNGSVDKAPSPKIAEQACMTLGARLPNEFEIEILNAYGDWSGGVSVEGKYWALTSNKVFAPNLRNPSPVREVWETNAEEYYYYCVR